MARGGLYNEAVEQLLSWLRHFAPFLALALLLAAIVLSINRLGRHLEKHDHWLARLDLKLGNLHKDRKATWARELQFGATEPVEPPPLVPPPLPPRAPTLNATDWRDDDAATEELQKRQTGRYPAGEPPKGPNDDNTR